MEPVNRAPLSTQVAQSLLDEITSGRWAVGEQIPGETTLAAEFGVGRSTLREAIRQLVAQGVLRTRQGVGAFVESHSPVRNWNVEAKVADINDVLQVRVAIETRAASLAANHRSAADMEAIRQGLHARPLAGTADAPTIAAHDIEFHRRIVAASRSDLLLTLFESIQNRLIHSMSDLISMAGMGDDDGEVHETLVRLIDEQDSEGAEAASRHHLLSLAQAVMELR
jgi:DNA-binding FadR family transcriptional regulator